MEEIKDRFNYRTELENNNVIAIVPTGNSMWPTLKNRKQSVIIAKKTERLKHLDVALYERKDGKYVLHRVMEVLDIGYITCGDSQTYLEMVEEDAVIGVMTAFYRGKKCVEVSEKNYIEQVKKWYANEKRRGRKIKKFFSKQRLKYKIKYIIKRLIGR
jgi:hypothetical protein